MALPVLLHQGVRTLHVSQSMPISMWISNFIMKTINPIPELCLIQTCQPHKVMVTKTMLKILVTRNLTLLGEAEFALVSHDVSLVYSKNFCKASFSFFQGVSKGCSSSFRGFEEFQRVFPKANCFLLNTVWKSVEGEAYSAM